MGTDGTKHALRNWRHRRDAGRKPASTAVPQRSVLVADVAGPLELERQLRIARRDDAAVDHHVDQVGLELHQEAG